MQFNSYSYLVFLSVAVLLFWCFPIRWRRGLVLVASLLFYASWDVRFLVLPAIICAVAYASASSIRQNPQRNGFYLSAGIATVLTVLGFFKYTGFVLRNIGLATGSSAPEWLMGVIVFGLPLGISFYSFEAISFLLDARQGRVKSADFMDLSLFVMFWPHLIAGPIVRFRELGPQLKFEGTFKREYLIAGLDRFIWGLVQKNMIANSIGSWVDTGFLPQAAASNSTIDNWALAVAFGLQIYFDFAAYSNMAIGAAHLLGVKLPENFRSPYLAANPAEFWSRWHMTLSRWIRDYLFFPLNARFQDSRGRLYLSLIGVMALVGLWHGAGWGFIVWGVLQGCFLVLYRVFERIQAKYPLFNGWLVRAGCRMATLALIAAAWIPFRAVTLGQMIAFFTRMFIKFSFGLSYSINFYLVTLLIAAICAFEPIGAYLVTRFDNATEKNSSLCRRVRLYAFRPALYAVGILLFMIFDDQDTKFIYFQF
jgi:alginate O-acetyltransferase complex protein AlgI